MHRFKKEINNLTTKIRYRLGILFILAQVAMVIVALYLMEGKVDPENQNTAYVGGAHNRNAEENAEQHRALTENNQNKLTGSSSRDGAHDPSAAALQERIDRRRHASGLAQ